MSKVEVLVYVGMAFVIMLLLPLEEVSFLSIAGIGFAGALLGIVAWNALNEDVGDE